MPDSLQLLRCHLAAGAYGFAATAVRGVHRWESATARNPDLPAGCIGLLDQTPVYPLPYLLGLQEEAVAGAGPVLLLDGFAVQVDRVSRPVTVPLSDFRGLPRPLRDTGGRIQGLARLAGELTLCLNPDALSPGAAATAPPNWPPDEPWAATAAGDTPRLLCFLPPDSGERTYFGISFRQVLEVAQGLPFTRLHSANSCVTGLVDWRSRAVPVVDMAALAGAGASAGVNLSRLLIARSPRTRELFAFPAEHLAPVAFPLAEDSMVSRNIPPPSPFIRGAYTIDDGFLFVPDLEALADN